jgi:hypothetical protein
MTAPEAALVQSCREVAERFNAFLAVVGQRNARKSGSTLGFPDAVLFCSGEVRFVEFKDHKTGRLNLGQTCFIARALEQGIEIHVVDNVSDFVSIVNSCRSSHGVRRTETR